MYINDLISYQTRELARNSGKSESKLFSNILGKIRKVHRLNKIKKHNTGRTARERNYVQANRRRQQSEKTADGISEVIRNKYFT